MIPFTNAIAAILIAFLFGWVLIDLLWPFKGAFRSDAGLKSCLAVGAGLGFVSCHYFLSLDVFDSNRNVIASEVLLLLLLGCTYHVLSKRRGSGGPTAAKITKANDVRSWFTLCMINILCFSFLRFILRAINNPHGEWDAWAIWNLRARFLYRGSDQISTAFSNQYAWSHPDYPLLISSNVARLWQFAGQETILCPMVLAGMFTAATAGLLYYALAKARGTLQGTFGLIAFLGIRYIVTTGAGQLADMPLAFFILSGIVLLYYHYWTKRGGTRYLLLAGMMASFAAWTKNEGQLFFIVLFLAQCFVAFRTMKFSEWIRNTAIFFLGALPLLLVLLFFKLHYAPANDLVSGQGWTSTLSRIGDIDRYYLILKAGLHYGIKVLGVYAIILPPFLFGWGRSEHVDRKGTLAVTIALLLQTAGYAAVYLTTPRDLDWHLSSSIRRLIVQLLPGYTFIFFIIMKTPEEKRADLSQFLFKKV